MRENRKTNEKENYAKKKDENAEEKCVEKVNNKHKVKMGVEERNVTILCL
jgi:hypothetical protein